jgi:putative endopeptidase
MKMFWLRAAAVGAISLGASTAFAQPAPSEASLQPSYGAWGFDPSGENKAVKPGDDFNLFANGTYIDNLKIPADQTSYGSFNILHDLSEARVRHILEDAAGKTAEVEPKSLDGKIGAAYRAFLDEARVESFGAKPLEHDLSEVRAVKSRAELAYIMGKGAGGVQSSLFSVGIQPDDKDPNRYVIQVDQDGLGLPDRDYYLTAQFAAKKTDYQAYVAKMLGLIGWEHPEAAAKAVVDYETQVAEASWSKAQMRDPDAVYNPMTVEELQHFAPGFEWASLMRGADLGTETHVLIDAKSAFPKLAALYAETPLETLKAWEAFRIADASAPYLSKSFIDARFEFRGHDLTGQEVNRPRWKRGVAAALTQQGEARGDIYKAR